MVGRKKGFTAKQSRRMSRRMERSTVGSHVQRRTHTPSAQRTNADSVSFSNSRAGNRAARGEVSALIPETSSRESAGAYRSRVQQRRYVEQIQQRAKRRRFFAFALVIVAILAAAIGVGCAVFMGTTGSEMSLRDSDATEALSKPVADKPSYTLISAELGSVAVPLDNGGPDVLLLARVDKQNAKLSLVLIPGNTRVVLTDNQEHPISDAASQGDAGLIEAVKKLTEVDIAHYVKLDADGVAGIVDALGGVDVTLSQIIDDPQAGTLQLPKGMQRLNGQAALVYLRSANLKWGEQDRMNNQIDFAAETIAKLFAAEGTLNFAGRLDAIGAYLQTDYSSGDLMGLADAFGNLSADQIVKATTPGYMDAALGVDDTQHSSWVTTASAMRELIQSIDAGEAIAEVGNRPDTSEIDPSSFTVEVQNGTDMTGAAATTAELLTQAGFNVTQVGNAEEFIYEETLLVYQGEQGRAYAQMVIDTLGAGRIVDSSEYYTFGTDVLVILGSDYKPTA